MAEKASLEEAVRSLAQRFGVGYFLTGGSPAVISTEYFSERLRRRTAGPIQLVSLCDHDPFGYDIPLTLAAQLRRYGVAVRDEVSRLVRPERFTSEELGRIALPIDTSSDRIKTRVRRWMQETGGTGGQPLGIHADHLRPIERVVQAFEEELKLAQALLQGLGEPG